MDSKTFIELMLTALGQEVANSFVKMINQYPSNIRPAVIGQMEALIAGIRSTFSEKENSIADAVRSGSQTVAIVMNKAEEGKEAEDGES
jgi:predicted GTPase